MFDVGYDVLFKVVVTIIVILIGGLGARLGIFAGYLNVCTTCFHTRGAQGITRLSTNGQLRDGKTPCSATQKFTTR